MEEYITGTGQKISVHNKKGCKGNCVIHNPSDHVMKNFPTHWRDDRSLMERICKCGVGHPDPDDLEFKKSIGMDIKVEGIHGCCGIHCDRGIRINGFSKYFIDFNGNIWNDKLKRYMKSHDKKGYLHVQLNENGKRIYKSIHRLVAETYISNIDNKRTVNHKHKDSDTYNNNVSNLEWCTDSENIQHSYDNERRLNAKKVYDNNEKSKRKLTENDIKKIFEMREDGTKIKDISVLFSVHKETISRVLRGITYKEFISKEEMEI